ncbi:MAG: phosphatidylglycerophosphatase A [Balneolaceae bacterium]
MDRIKLLVGSGFGVGYAPVAPGTLASLVALLPLYWIITSHNLLLLPALLLLFCALTLWVSSSFEERFGKDPAKLVTDEWAGQFLTFSGISFTGIFSSDILFLLTGFVLFRLFDIWKPLGIKRIQNLHSGWGVLADDLVAGFYALICLKTLTFVWPNYFGII